MATALPPAACIGRVTLALTLLTACRFEPPALHELRRPDVIGDRDDDILGGTARDDVMVGGRGDDKLAGGEGDDILAGEWGRDELVGGPGSDIFVLDANNLKQPDRILDLEERDSVLLAPDLVRRLPKPLAESIRVEGGRLEVRVAGRWTPVATGFEDELRVSVDPSGRALMLKFQVRF